VIGAGSKKSLVIPIGNTELNSRVLRLRSALAGYGNFEIESGLLYQELIAPLQLPTAIKVVFIPDKVLHRVPFGALKNNLTGRYLIEDHAVELAPAASVYLQCAARARALRRVTPSILVVIDPAFDLVLAPSLARLPGAKNEGAAIARLYNRADVLTDDAATPTRLLLSMGGHQIVHFGGHAEIDGRSPFFSRLLLAPDAQGSGILFAYELYHRSFVDTSLVVLAACNSAADQVAGSEGVSSLARPFLAAGIPAVIGSLWAVSDHASAEMSVELHRLLAKGQDAATALRGAVLSQMHRPSSIESKPNVWAAFELFGASASCLENGG
jgi:CHAT domain-containing protein